MHWLRVTGRPGSTCGCEARASFKAAYIRACFSKEKRHYAPSDPAAHSAISQRPLETKTNHATGQHSTRGGHEDGKEKSLTPDPRRLRCPFSSATRTKGRGVLRQRPVESHEKMGFSASANISTLYDP